MKHAHCGFTKAFKCPTKNPKPKILFTIINNKEKHAICTFENLELACKND